MNFCYILSGILAIFFPQFDFSYFRSSYFPEERVTNTSVNNLFMLLFSFISPLRWIGFLADGFFLFLLFLGSDKQNKEMSGEELKIGNPITRDTNGMPQTKQKKINQRNELPSWKGETLEVLEFFKFFKHTLSHLTKTKKKG